MIDFFMIDFFMIEIKLRFISGLNVPPFSVLLWNYFLKFLN